MRDVAGERTLKRSARPIPLKNSEFGLTRKPV